MRFLVLALQICLVLLLPRASAAAGDPVVEVLTSLASNLSAGNSPAFLKNFDSAMPDYSQIETDANALAAQMEIVCSIDPLGTSGDNASQSWDLDWFMQLRSRAEGGPLERRRARVRIQVKKQRGVWKIVAFEPVSVLAPVAVR